MNLSDIKLLHIFNSYIFGGLELSTIEYFRELEPELNKLHYYASSGPLDTKLENLSTAKFNHSSRKINYNPFNFIINLFQLLNLISREKFNIIDYHHRLCLPFIFFIRLRFPRIKIIYTSHNRYNDWLSKHIIADKIIAVSKSTSKDNFNCPPEIITIIKHGLRDINERMNTSEFQHRIGYVGRFEHEKGIKYLLEMIRELASADNKFKFVLIGDGSLKDEITEFVKKEKLLDRIELYSNLSDKQAIYSKFDIMVLPSITLEGFGLVLLEAMSFGVPVIAAETGGIPEIIENRVNGILVPPRNSAALSEAVKNLSSAPELRSKLVSGGYALLKKKFKFAETITNYRSFFESI